jgi:mono/diheme cytochrome c family protein
MFMIRQATPRASRIAWPIFSAVVILMAFQQQSIAQKAPLTEKDVLPVIQRCFQCHGEALKMGGLDLHTRDAMLKGGDHGPAIVVGSSASSFLLKRVTGEVQPKMPMAPVPALTDAEIATLKDWIDQGAKWAPAPTAAPAPAATSTSPAGYQRRLR